MIDTGFASTVDTFAVHSTDKAGETFRGISAQVVVFADSTATFSDDIVCATTLSAPSKSRISNELSNESGEDTRP